jgi:cytochrome P450
LGKTVDRIHIAKGTILSIQSKAVQTSHFVWGDDCKEFKPERWLNDGKYLPERAKEMRGHRHLLSFVDGPRM